jgi:transposase
MGRRQRSTTVTIAGLSVGSGSASSRRVGRRPHSRRAFNRQQPRQSPSLGERLKKGEFEEAIGRSRGGRTSKIHALADDRGRPVAFALTPGNVADVVMAIPLLAAVAKPKRLLADKAYDADSLRRWLKHRKIRAAIPSTASRRTPYPLDRAAYKRRNVIERMFCKLKNWRRISHRNSLRPTRSKLSLQPRSRRYHHRLDLIETPT